MYKSKLELLTISYVNKILREKLVPSSDGWKMEAKELDFSESMINKGCPRNAFLGLCSSGLVKNIPKGIYTKSIKNRTYAEKAVEILRKNPGFANNPLGLWKKIQTEEITHNGQMNVVCALWKNGLIKQ